MIEVYKIYFKGNASENFLSFNGENAKRPRPGTRLPRFQIIFNPKEYRSDIEDR